MCVCVNVAQALQAAEAGEVDPLNRTSSVITLQLIMQSEAAGMFHHPSSGKQGHALLAASAARMQADQAQRAQHAQQTQAPQQVPRTEQQEHDAEAEHLLHGPAASQGG